MPAPQEITAGRWEMLIAHRPDLALWLQYQRDAVGGSEMAPELREELEERAFYASGDELLAVLSQMTKSGDLISGPESLHVKERI